MLRVTSVWTTQQGAPYYSTHHFSGTSDADALAAKNAVAALWGDLQAELWNGSSIIVSGDVPRIDPATGEIETMFTMPSTPVQPTGAGEVLPWATQCLIRWRTGVYLDGREVRGRTFVPAFREVSSTLGKPTPSLVTGVNTLLASWMTEQPLGNLLCIWSRPTPERPGAQTIVTSGTMWEQWAQLRSRRD